LFAGEFSDRLFPIWKKIFFLDTTGESLMRILLAEDDSRVAGFVRRGMREEQYAVDVAPDGEKALFMAQTGEYDLIILDLMLPKKDGMEVLRTLRSSKKNTPVLILTAKDKPKDKVTA